MLTASVLPHLNHVSGLWPVRLCRDGLPIGPCWLATPLAQAALDRSRAGTLADDYAVYVRPAPEGRFTAEMACSTGCAP